MTSAEMNDLLHVAQRVVWFKPPVEAMADEPHFVAHVLCHGALSDIQRTRHVMGDDRVRSALAVAPSGIFTPRQWVFWNRYFGMTPVAPMPKRQFDA